MDIPFGLCNLGMGFPELGYVLGLSIERDMYFEAEKPLSGGPRTLVISDRRNAAEASSAGHILA